MRTRYHRALDTLSRNLSAMCRRNESAIADATRALLTADLDLAERVIDDCTGIGVARAEAEHAAVTLLALEAPVAGELRRVVTAIHLVDDLNRMGALAEHIARIARMRHPGNAVPEAVRPLLADMGAVAGELAARAARVLATADEQAAAELRERDRAMDALHRRLLGTVLAPEWAEGTVAAVDLALLGRYYERFADHAAQVGDRTLYIATGTLAATPE